MSLALNPARLQQAVAAQRGTLNPRASVWVGANAGTGKTTVLTRRIVALLLADPALEPRQILALTFTNAAAGEMAERLPRLANQWAGYDEAYLQENLEAAFALPFNPTIPARLQQIATAIREQSPFITTLHGFAQQVLGAMPSVGGGGVAFELMDDHAQSRLLRRVQDELLLESQAAVLPYLNLLLGELGDRAWRDLTRTMVQGWWRLEALAEGHSFATAMPAMLARLDAALGLPPHDVCWQPLMPTPLQRAALAKLGKDVANEEAWLEVLLTKLQPRKRILTKAEVQVVGEEVLATLVDAAEHAATMLKARAAWRGRNLTEALLVWAQQVHSAYTHAKLRQGLKDFSDLLHDLQRVFANADSDAQAQWLWHRLDTRFRHLVVDEAQDNNSAQNQIVAWLTQQLLAGDVGAAPRTVLAVGDVKQSIYRFQGARPELFLGLRALLEEWSQPFARVDLTHTFRNGETILAVVNAVFAEAALATAVQGEAAPWPTHHTVAEGRPARVEIWPLEPYEKAVMPEGRWLLADERAALGLEKAKLRCLTRVADWLVSQHARGVVLPSCTDAHGQPRPLAWRDVLIVVQRNETAALMVSLLRQKGIPVATERGLQPPLVEDVMALLRLVFNPADNLSCAQVLKGLCGWDDAQLLALAASVPDQSPWLEAVQEAGPRSLRGFLNAMPPGLPPAGCVQWAAAWWGLPLATLGPLLNWAEAAANQPDARFGVWGGLISRLEEHADDLPVVAEVGVRVLTGHRAKGLEAPLVILPETTAAMDDIRRETLLWGDGLVLFKQSAENSDLGLDLYEKAKAATRADSLRALYVALTRAADWLVITGWEAGNSRKPK